MKERLLIPQTFRSLPLFCGMSGTMRKTAFSEGVCISFLSEKNCFLSFSYVFLIPLQKRPKRIFDAEKQPRTVL